MKCAICGGELAEGALCSTYFFTVAKARAQYCPSCKMVFAPVVRTDED